MDQIPRAIVYGGLTAGALDLIDAFVFFGVRSGAQPVSILHSIAAGFVGREAARGGGMSTALLGVFAHFLVAFCIVTVFVLASRVLPVLRKQWVLYGIAFGFVAYLVMTWFVVPLSNAGNGIDYVRPAGDAGIDQRHPDPRIWSRTTGGVLRLARSPDP